MPIIKRSRYAYAETLARLQTAIAGAGNTIFITIDQAAAAATAGLALRPTSLIVFGNPKGGTLLMQAAPLIALELPLKLLVWEDDGAVDVAYVPVTEAAAHYGLSEKGELLAAIDRNLAALTDSIAQASN